MLINNMAVARILYLAFRLMMIANESYDKLSGYRNTEQVGLELKV
jgi:hypothetical protein